MKFRPRVQLIIFIVLCFVLFLLLMRGHRPSAHKEVSEPELSPKEILNQKLEKEFNRNAKEMPPPTETNPEPVFLTPDPGINTSTDPRMP